MSVYIITHKKFQQQILTDSSYKTLLVGAYKGHVTGNCFDDVGENISEKNKNYCELTGLYWLWKHSSDSYIGIVHYRRYFTHDFNGRVALRGDEINRLLTKYDIILPFHRTYDKSIEEDYCEISGFKKDLDRVRFIIEQNCPEYLDDFDEIMSGHKAFLYNMFITNKNNYDSYCKWLFTILFKLEEQIDLTDYNEYQKRIYGFLSERLLNVWIKHNKLKLCEVGVISTERNVNHVIKIATGIKRSLLFNKYRDW